MDNTFNLGGSCLYPNGITPDKGEVRSRISRDQLFIGICQLISKRSTCLRSQVGAVIVKDGRILSIGYNGPASGIPPCVKPPKDWNRDKEFLPDWLGVGLSKNYCEGPGCTRSLHAEANAIAFAARSGVAVEGCTLYCTMSPCINCAKVIINSGIKEVKYLEEYRDTSGIDLLLRVGITVGKLEGPRGEVKFNE